MLDIDFLPLKYREAKQRRTRALFGACSCCSPLAATGHGLGRRVRHSIELEHHLAAVRDQYAWPWCRVSN